MGKRRKAKKPVKNKGGRPITRIVRIDATAEEIAQKLFTNAKTPDPSIRIRNKPEE